MQKFKSLGLAALVLGFVLVLEAKSAAGAFAVNSGFDALTHAGLSGFCALLAFVFSRIAGHYKADVRPFVREVTPWARAVAIACVIVPTVYLATALKHERVERTWEAYQGSAAQAADAAVMSDPMADRYEREAARARSMKPSLMVDVADPEFLVALALQILAVMAAGIPLHAPASEAEIKHWRKVEAGKKAAATRKRNAAKRKAKGNVLPFRKKTA